MRRYLLTTIGASLLALASACGSDKGQTIQVEPPPPGVSSAPKWLTFTCTNPGCSTTLTATVSVVGNRNVAVRRVLLSEKDREDFVLKSSKEPPFILKAGEQFTVEVTYNPTGDPRLGDIQAMVTYTDASASDSPDRIAPGELEVPLVRRLIGEPKLSVDPGEITFGAVLQTARKKVPVKVSNIGYGNVGLVIDKIEVEPASAMGEVIISDPPPFAIVPGASWEMEVTYEPMQESFLRGQIVITPVGRTVSPATIPILGTSIPRPSIVADPAEGIDFGEVPVGTTAMEMLKITNRGAQDLHLNSLEVVNPPSAAKIDLIFPPGVETSTLTPLQSTMVLVQLEAQDAGQLDSVIRIRSNDYRQRILEVPVKALLAKPRIQVEPGMVDFGSVPRGWTRVIPVQVSNAGYGELEITNVSMLLGSSDLFTLRNVPSLPAKLRHGERLALEIEFRSEAEASFSGTLSVDSNDPDTPYVETPLAAQGASCAEGCPIANGTPDCSAGTCAIGSCDTNWYDADMDPATGCECREHGRGDPGAFCADAVYLGSLSDDGDRATFTGIIPEMGDVDIIRFHARDASQFLKDDFDVRINLESSDPGIRMCIYRHDTEGHLTECFLENERCNVRSYRKDGSLGREDGADFVIRIFRAPNSAPTCTSYSIFMRNG